MDNMQLYDLPAEVEEAFPIFEHRLREKHLDDSHGDPSINDRREYAIGLIGFCSEYDLELSVSLDELMSWDTDEFFPAFTALEGKARILSVQYSLRRNRRSKAGIDPVYVLDDAQKSHIHEQLKVIREIIAEADLSDQKRDALAKRLNAFAEEVDRDRTRGEALMAFYIASKREVKDIAALADHVEKVFRLLSKAKEYLEALPAPKIPKQIPGPNKPRTTNSSQELDDEIPF